MDLGQVAARLVTVNLEVLGASVAPVIEAVGRVQRTIGGDDADVVNDEHRPAKELRELAADHNVEVLAGLDGDGLIAADVVADRGLLSQTYSSGNNSRQSVTPAAVGESLMAYQAMLL